MLNSFIIIYYFISFRDEDHLIDRYAVSPKMSTYLVAFAIGDMDYLETRSGTTQVSSV